MKKVELVIKGRKVVDVGYRPYLLLAALDMGISKFHAYNLRTDDINMVLVQLQGNEERVTKFINFAKSNFPENAQVEIIEEREYEREIMDACLFLQLLQFEQVNKGIPAIISIDSTLAHVDKTLVDVGKAVAHMDETLIGMNETLIGVDKTLTGMDKTLTAMDKTLTNIDKKQDLMLDGQNTVISVLGSVKEDTSTIREDMSSLSKLATLEEKYERLSREISGIKADLSVIKAKVA